ncbi:MAG: hypothetical protein KAW12_21125 [Candidatus Aminicenantes bacterium]|nr:hypothetical protein [Candidatus Aminicenantes bacterium]
MTDQTQQKNKIVFLILGVFFLFFVTFLLPKGIIKLTFNYIVSNIVNVSGMSHWLAKGIVIIALIPFMWAVSEIFKIKFRIKIFGKTLVKSYRKLAGIIIIVYMSIFFLSMHFLSRDSYFTHDSGKVLKWYAETPEGIHYFDTNGYDPEYGIKLKPVTPEIVEKHKKQQMKMYPKQVFLETLEGVEFFDSITGNPKIWYYQDTDGSFEFFNGPGFHPTYNSVLKPVTPDIIISLKKKVRENQEKAAAEIEKIEAGNERQKRLAYLQRYINPYFSNIPGSKEVALLVVDEKLRAEYVIEQKLVSILKLQGKNPVLSIFKKPFIDDGIFERVFSGNLDLIKSLALNNHVDYIILAKKYSKFRNNPQVWDGISSDLTIQIKVIATNPIKVVNTTIISAIGPGYTNEEAEKNAIDKVYDDFKKFLKEIQ